MLTYMRHDEHGVTIAYDEPTIESNKANGWVIIDDYEKYHAGLIAAKTKTTKADDAWLNGDTKPASSRKGK